jgi:hypothetical protein
VEFTIDGCDADTELVHLLHDEPIAHPDDKGRVQIALEGYGYRWLRIMSPDERRLA